MNAGNKLINLDRRQRAHFRSFSFSTMVLSNSCIFKTLILLRIYFACIFSELHRTLSVICEWDFCYELLTNATRLLRSNNSFLCLSHSLPTKTATAYNALCSLLAALFGNHIHTQYMYIDRFSQIQKQKNPKPYRIYWNFFLFSLIRLILGVRFRSMEIHPHLKW